MDQSFDITPFLKIAPLALLILGAIFLVLRGLGRKPDGSKNKADIGGGPGTD